MLPLSAGSFRDAEKQPPFAAFIRSHSGKRSVVVLDEFEKMEKDVHTGLLGILQDGGSMSCSSLYSLTFRATSLVHAVCFASLLCSTAAYCHNPTIAQGTSAADESDFAAGPPCGLR